MYHLGCVILQSCDAVAGSYHVPTDLSKSRTLCTLSDTLSDHDGTCNLMPSLYLRARWITCDPL